MSEDQVKSLREAAERALNILENPELHPAAVLTVRAVDILQILSRLEQAEQDRDTTQRAYYKRELDYIKAAADVMQAQQERDIAMMKVKNVGADAERMMNTLTSIEVLLGTSEDDYVDHVEAVRAVVEQRDEYKLERDAERARAQQAEAELTAEKRLHNASIEFHWLAVEERDSARQRARQAEAAHAEAVAAFHDASRLRSMVQEARIKAEDEVVQLRAQQVTPCTFGDLNHPVRVSLVDEIPEAPGALGYQVTTDEEHRVDLRRGQPRLGTITTLIHEMLHVAEAASGFSVPHHFISMGSVGVVLVLARCGLLGATDEEIKSFIDYMKTCEDTDDQKGGDSAVDPVEECERLYAEVERLKVALPTQDEREALILVAMTYKRDYPVSTARAISGRLFSWLERLDTAKAGK